MATFGGSTTYDIGAGEGDTWSDRLAAALEKELGDIHVDVPTESFGDADFIDNGHFSVRGARRFAEVLAPVVRDACRGAMLSSAPR